MLHVNNQIIVTQSKRKEMLTLEIIGNIGSDAIIKDINGQKYISFSVANTDTYTTNTGERKEITTWVSCLKKGESSICQYLKKGTQVFVRGSMSINIYDYKGQKTAGINDNVREIFLCSSSKKTENNNNNAPY